MSKISIAILYVVILGIITGMYLEVPYLTGGTGAFIVIALVYSFVVAKRELALMTAALEEQREDDGDALEEEPSDQPIIPDWLKTPNSAAAVPPRPTGTTPPAPQPSPRSLRASNPASRGSFGRSFPA